MARSGKDQSADMPAGAFTGRDGAIDFVHKEELLQRRTGPMQDDHIYRVIEIVGTSEKSIEDAIETAVARAHKTLRNLRWFEVARMSGHLDKGKVQHYQVTLKVGFTMEDAR